MVGEDECETRSALVVGAAVACCLLRWSVSAYCKIKDIGRLLRCTHPESEPESDTCRVSHEYVFEVPSQSTITLRRQRAHDSADLLDFNQQCVSEASLPREL